MFRHIVMFKWKDGVTAELEAQIASGLRACALALSGTLAYEAGPDLGIEPSPGAIVFDFALVGDFEDEAAWRAYDTDSEHNRLRAELIRPVIAERAQAQFNI